ncbi:GumC family protein [Pararhizobium mangrovi]|uniref:Polysaccharide chain length determinant N-terminal domain-containing protein n=1 Tax=Pararhizobium mangrovi TaxID=2590452 RepID=A0A506U3U2_9HYPH|nr:exopolysaccharide transport family protein [Pararhizobium mangrovi]TPW29012.1 hypothetical protein FJU11_08510 [Pararhizobium mangrovi]
MDTTVAGKLPSEVHYADQMLGPQTNPTGAIGLVDILRLLRSRRFFIASFIVVGVLAVCLTVLGLHDRYTATAVIVLEDGNSQVMQEVSGVQANQRTRSAVETEIDILTSRKLAARVVDELHLTQNPEFSGNPITQAPDGVVDRLIARSKAFVKTFMGPLSDGGTEQQSGQDTAITALLSHIDISRNDESLAISLSATTQDPALSARIANSLAQNYISATQEHKKEDLENVIGFLQAHNRALASTITRDQQAISNFARNNDLPVEARDDLIRQRIDSMNTQLTTARVSLADLDAQQNQGRAVMAGDTSLDGTNLSSALLTSLRAQRSELEREKAQFETDYGANHPKVRRVAAQITSVDGMIHNELRHVLDDLSAQEKVAADRVHRLESQLSDLHSALQDRSLAAIRLENLQRNLVMNQNLYNVIASQVGKLDPFAKLTGANARIVSTAITPNQASFPHRRRIVVFSAVGIAILALISALLLEVCDKRLRSGDQARRLVNLPDLGSLPRTNLRPPGRTGIAEAFARRRPTVHTEAFRSLYLACRTQLSGTGPVVLVTSPMPCRQSLECGFGLACAAAVDGRKTAYLDLDVEQSGSLPRTGKASPLGIEDVLAGRCDLQEASSTPENIPGLSLFRLNSSLDPLGYTSSFEEMRSLIEQLQANYDLIVVNCAPVLLVNDGNWLSPIVDAAILLVRFRKTTVGELSSAAASLRASHAPLIGTAMTGVDDRLSPFAKRRRRFLGRRYGQVDARGSAA